MRWSLGHVCFFLSVDIQNVKLIVHPKMNILSSFTRLHFTFAYEKQYIWSPLKSYSFFIYIWLMYNILLPIWQISLFWIQNTIRSVRNWYRTGKILVRVSIQNFTKHWFVNIKSPIFFTYPFKCQPSRLCFMGASIHFSWFIIVYTVVKFVVSKMEHGTLPLGQWKTTDKL